MKLNNKEKSELFAALHQLDLLKRNNEKMAQSLDYVEQVLNTPATTCRKAYKLNDAATPIFSKK
jgi:uncharacterized protein YciW